MVKEYESMGRNNRLSKGNRSARPGSKNSNKGSFTSKASCSNKESFSSKGDRPLFDAPAKSMFKNKRQSALEQRKQ